MCPRSIMGVPFDSVGSLRTTWSLLTTCMCSWCNWSASCVAALQTKKPKTVYTVSLYNFFSTGRANINWWLPSQKVWKNERTCVHSWCNWNLTVVPVWQRHNTNKIQETRRKKDRICSITLCMRCCCTCRTSGAAAKLTKNQKITLYNVVGGLAVWWHNKPKTKNSFVYLSVYAYCFKTKIHCGSVLGSGASGLPGRAASGGALAPKPPRATRSQPEPIRVF